MIGGEFLPKRLFFVSLALLLLISPFGAAASWLTPEEYAHVAPITGFQTAGSSSFLETFDGNPPAPEPFTQIGQSRWDIQVHNRDPDGWYTFHSMQAMHGHDCSAPPASHTIDQYEDAVFKCRNHLMTAMNSNGYAVIYFTPNHMVDFSNGQAVIQFDMSTEKMSGRDWWDISVSPFLDAQPLPLLSDLSQGVDLQKPNRNSVVITSDNGEGAPNLKILRNGADTSYGNTFFDMGTGITPGTNQMAVRQTFKLTLSRTHLKFERLASATATAEVIIDEAISPALTWTQGVVQFGHHAYNADKDGAGVPATWHWDTVSMSPTVPFTMIKANKRYVDGNGGTINFNSPAPANSYLRFSAICIPRVNGVAGTKMTDDGHPEHHASYMMPIAQGTTSAAITFGPDGWYSGHPCFAKDFAIWSLSGASASPPPINPPADTVAPVRSAGSPSGTLVSGTTSATVSLTTNEASTCKYSTTAGKTYATMTGTFTTTGGTSHSRQFTGLAAGQFSFFVRCSDSAGNANGDDYAISFSIASVSTPTNPPPITPPPATSPPTPPPATPPPATPPAPSSPASDSRISWQGGSWYLHGVNVPWYNWACDFGCNQNGGASSLTSVLEPKFQQLKNSGIHVVRWWVFPGDNPWQISKDSNGAPTGVNNAVYADFDAALALADKYDLYYDFVLFSSPNAIPSDWLTDSAKRAKLASSLGPLFARYKNNPRIITWEIFNEPENAIWNSGAPEAATQETVKAIAASIHQNSNAYAAVGSLMLDGVPLWKGLGLDYYDAHWYDYMQPGNWCARCTTYAEVKSRYSLDKPILIGEFYDGPSTDSLQKYEDWYAKGYAGAFAWSLFSERTNDKLEVNLAAAKTFASRHADIGPSSTSTPPPNPPPVTPPSTPPPATPPPATPTGSFIGQYYDDIALTRFLFSREDRGVSFNWGLGAPASSMEPDTFSARWKGTFTFDSAPYTFLVTADDGFRLLIDDVVVLDQWVDQPATKYEKTITPGAGAHTIELQYYENGGAATISLDWVQTQQPAPVPPSNCEVRMRVDGVAKWVAVNPADALWMDVCKK